MALMVNGKKVVGYALGGNEFYSIDEHADGTITYNGHTYIWKPKASSDSLTCTFHSNTTPCSVSVDLSQKLRDSSALTVKDLINKGEIIKLAVTFDDTTRGTEDTLNSGIIDLSKPGSKGHFNFQWADGATSTNTYCYPDSSANMFLVYSDAFSTFVNSDYYDYSMVITSDES